MSKASTPLYKGPRLLVPVMVDAMIVDQANLTSQKDDWARNPAQYSGIINGNYKAVFPREYAYLRSGSPHSKDTALIPKTGIHLQWILPDKLVHGQQSESDPSKINFYQIPNRWLVVRVWENGGQLKYKGWVVASNFFVAHNSPFAKGGTSPYLRMKNTPVKGGNIEVPEQYPGFIGQVYDWEDWVKTTSDKQTPPITTSSQTDLRGVAPFNVAYNSYTTDNENVLSFVDQATAADLGVSAADLKNDGVALRYLVSGWYDDPMAKDSAFEDQTVYQDPVYQPDFTAKAFLKQLTEFDFDIGGSQGLQDALSSFKKQYSSGTITSPYMLCHGAIHSINWYGPDNIDGTKNKSNSIPGVPLPNHDHSETLGGITIGNSSFDALAAFIRNQLSINSLGLSSKEIDFAIDLMYSLHYNQVESFTETNGPHKLSKTVHESWFEGSSAGSYWEIDLLPDVEKTAAIEASLTKALPLLKTLNGLQDQLQQKTEQKEALLKEFYLCSYAQYQHKLDNPSLSTVWEGKATAIFTSISNLGIAAVESSISKTITKINTALGIQTNGNSNAFKLKEIPKPKYWKPNDPVLLIHAAKTSNKYGYNKTLACRLSGQTLTNLTLNNTATKLAPEISLPVALGNRLPKETSALLLELILLDPTLADFLNAANTETVQKQQTLIWNNELYEGFDTRLLVSNAGFTGTRPSFRSFQTYTPPWSPLYMDWGVYYAPNAGTAGQWKVAASKTNSANALTNWSLLTDSAEPSWSLSNNDYDYQWTGTSPDFIPKVTDKFFDNIIKVTGRSLISSHLPEFVKQQLQNIDPVSFTDTERVVIEAVANMLDGFDIITQRLSGFNEALNKYDINNAIPAGTLVDASANNALASYNYLNEQHFGVPIQSSMMSLTQYNYYFPIRSGYLLPHYVRVTDDYGLGYYPTGYFEPDDGDATPVDTLICPRGIGLTNSNITDTRWSQLPPRVMQPCKSTMDWIDASISTAPFPPVSQSAQNTPICGWLVPNHLDKSIMIFDTDGKYQLSILVYQLADGTFAVKSDVNPLSNPTIENSYLDALVTEILSLNSANINAFMNQIDVAMWYTAPKAAHNKQGLGALLGRPLALVRASVSLELEGVPGQNFNLNKPDKGDPHRKFTPYDPTAPTTIPNPYGLNQVAFEFYLGTPQLPHNGLIGYFEDAAFDIFYVPQDHTEVTNTFVKTRSTHSTTLNNAGMDSSSKVYQYFTLLMDPRGMSHLVSGINPVFKLKLPVELYESALAQMNAVFKIGPMITDPTQLRMPKPYDAKKQLSWVYQSGVEIWKGDKKIKPGAYQNEQIEAASQTAMLNNQRNTINEGWLELDAAFQKENDD